MEYEIELADILKRSIQRFYENLVGMMNTIDHRMIKRYLSHLDQVENAKLALALVNNEDKVQGSVASVDDTPPLVCAQECI
jgi:hypothetical protein